MTVKYYDISTDDFIELTQEKFDTIENIGIRDSKYRVICKKLADVKDHKELTKVLDLIATLNTF